MDTITRPAQILKPEIKKAIKGNNDLVKAISVLNKNCLFGTVYQMLYRNSDKLFNIATLQIISETLNIPIPELSVPEEDILTD